MYKIYILKLFLYFKEKVCTKYTILQRFFTNLPSFLVPFLSCQSVRVGPYLALQKGDLALCL